MKQTRVIKEGPDGRRAYVWRVEFTVSETWVEDGFAPDSERFLDMLAHDLGCAYRDVEITARILAEPPLSEIDKAQGYSD